MSSKVLIHSSSFLSFVTLIVSNLKPLSDYYFPEDLGLEGCIEHVWRDTVVYLDDKSDPIMIGRAYGRVSRYSLHEELVKR